MPNHAGALQGRFFPAKLETEGDDAIFNTLLKEALALVDVRLLDHLVIGAAVRPVSFAERGLL